MYSKVTGNLMNIDRRGAYPKLGADPKAWDIVSKQLQESLPACCFALFTVIRICEMPLS